MAGTEWTGAEQRQSTLTHFHFCLNPIKASLEYIFFFSSLGQKSASLKICPLQVQEASDANSLKPQLLKKATNASSNVWHNKQPRDY